MQQKARKKAQDKRLEEITNLLLTIASGDFQIRGAITEHRDELDSIVVGINMLGEELQNTTVSRDYLENIYRGIADMLVVVDEQEHIEKINPAVCKVLGYEEDELLGRSFSALFAKQDHEALTELNTGLYEKGYLYNVERLFRSKSGRTIPVSLSSSILRNTKNQRLGGVHIAKDISQQKKTQEQLRTKNDALNTFVYKASHDLRGPLASMMGLVELAKSESSEDVRMHYVQLIGRSTERLNTVLNDLMEFTKISSSTLTLKHINFQELVEQIRLSLENIPDFKKIDFRVDIQQERDLISDNKILRSILYNLVDNAFKYRRPEVEDPFIDLTISDLHNGVAIVVKDNGTGMPPEVQLKAFDMFYRGSTITKGSGLGLFIVKNSVEKLGGEIDVQSNLGEGTCFRLFIPTQPPLGEEDQG